MKILTVGALRQLLDGYRDDLPVRLEIHDNSGLARLVEPATCDDFNCAPDEGERFAVISDGGWHRTQRIKRMERKP